LLGFAPVQDNEPVNDTTTLSHVLKDNKSETRHALLESAHDELVKAIVECY